MSLEEALAENTAALKEHTKAINDLLAAGRSAKAKQAAASNDDGDSDGDAPPAKAPAKRGPKAKGDAAGKKGPDLEGHVKAWLGEIDIEMDDETDEPVDTPENKAALKKRTNRKNFVKSCLEKVGATVISDVTDPDDAAKVIKWIDIRKTGKDPFAEEDDDM